MSTKYVGPKYLKWFYDIDWLGWPLIFGVTIGVCSLVILLASLWVKYAN